MHSLIKKTYPIGLVLSLITVLVLALGYTAARGQGETYKNNEITDSAFNADTLNDGPHVFLRDDSTTVIFYMCGEEVVKETRYGRDTVRFKGMCGDSDRVYSAAFSYPEYDSFEYDNVSKIFTVSDIHGEYNYFKDILVNLSRLCCLCDSIRLCYRSPCHWPHR